MEIDTLLREALEQPAKERLDFVIRRADSDPHLRDAVHALLDADESATQFLEEPVRIDPRTTREMFLLIALRAMQASPHDEVSQP
jgi:hypothetical protein